MQTSTSPKRVLISGASIAGPAVAYWLAKAGYDCTIVERAPELREGGYAIDVRGAAVDILKRMGLFDQLKSRETGTKTVQFVNGAGKPLITLDADVFGGRQGDDLELMRGTIARTLYEATAKTTTYIWGDSITSITEDDAGAHVTFEHAAGQTFDLVIGADGLHSNVRRLSFGEEAPFVKPLGAYISIATIPNYLNLRDQEVFYGMKGKTMAVYTAAENRELKVMCLFNSAPLTYDRHDSAVQKQLVAQMFANETGWEVPRLLQELQQTSDFYLDTIAQTQLLQWSKGRVALVGDAAYCPSPASGQGTTVALVGAYVLADAIVKAEGNHEQAWADYHTRLSGFVQQNLKLAPITLKGMIAPSGVMLGMQKLMFRFPAVFIGMNRQVMNLIQKAAHAISL